MFESRSAHRSAWLDALNIEKGLTMKFSFIVCLFTVCAFTITGMAASQTKFVDNSPAGNPFSVAASKDAKTSDCNVKLHDNDSRPVVAVVVAFDGDSNAAQRMTHDYFFRSDEHVAMHGKDFDMSFSCNQQTATITVKLIQFNDGRVWEGSDAKTITDLAADRREGMNYLNEVLTAVDSKAELAKPIQPGKNLSPRWGEQLACKSSPDPIGTAKERLANANAHASWLLNLK